MVVFYLGGHRIHVSVKIKRRYRHFIVFQAPAWPRPLFFSFFSEFFARARRYKTGGSSFKPRMMDGRR